MQLSWLAVASVLIQRSKSLVFTDVDCAAGTFIVRSIEDVIKINKCPVFIGNVFIMADDMSDIVLNGTTVISGELRAYPSEGSSLLKSLSSPTLRSVSSLAIEGLPSLAMLSFPAMTKLAHLRLVALRQLQECTISNGTPIPNVQSVMIVETALKSIGWLNWPVSETFDVQSNPNLTSMVVPGPTVAKDSSLYIHNNAALANIDAQTLVNVSGFMSVSSGAPLKELHFPHLEAITGTLSLSGQYENITMPAYRIYEGRLDVNSTRNITDLCFGDAGVGNEVQTYKCNSFWTDELTPWAKALANETANANTTAHDATDTAAKSHAATSNFSQVLIAVLTSVGAFLLTTCFLAYLFRRWRRKKKAQVAEGNVSQDEKRYTIGSMQELWCPEERLELPNGREMQELPSQCTQESGGQSIYELGTKHHEAKQKPKPNMGPLNSFRFP
ncbi:hypothetical protein BKA63DRAFT_489554 [Paraphoma chrysanthemicola]|nr:hypothetical protein BKA63DRAFT_489554 [Paraphoma chrysanthemicola]